MPEVKNHGAKIALTDLFKLPLKYCIAASLQHLSVNPAQRFPSVTAPDEVVVLLLGVECRKETQGTSTRKPALR